MNKLNQFFIFIIVFVLNFSACSKLDSTYFEYKVGDELVECNTFCNPTAYYLSDKDETTIEICTEDDRQAINIIIPGNSTGKWTNAGGAYILYTNDGTTGYEVFNDMKDTEFFTVIITEYGNVGDFISGTFSGKLVDELNNIIEISEGKFKVKRIINDYY